MKFDTLFKGKKQETEDPLRALLEKMIGSLYEQAKSKMPEKGPFDVIYEREDVKEMRLGLSHQILKITNVSFEGQEDKYAVKMTEKLKYVLSLQTETIKMRL